MNRRYIPAKEKRIGKKRNFRISYTLIFVLLAFLSIPFIVRITGHLLVVDDEYKSVECALLVTTEGSLESSYTALLDDIKTTNIDRVILSGTTILKTVSSADIALNELKYEEFDKEKLFYFYHDAHTLIGEAEYIIPFLRKKGVDTVVVYTAKHMTSRVKYIYNSIAEGNPHFLVSYSASELYNPKAWVQVHESRVLWASEWGKYIINWFELLFSPSLDTEIKVFNYESGYSVRTKDSDVELDDSLLENIPISLPISSTDTLISSSMLLDSIGIQQSSQQAEQSSQ